jgi:hypothetical protein
LHSFRVRSRIIDKKTLCFGLAKIVFGILSRFSLIDSDANFKRVAVVDFGGEETFIRSLSTANDA